LAAGVRRFPLPKAPVVEEIGDAQMKPRPPVTLTLLLKNIILIHILSYIIDECTSPGASDVVGIVTPT
jgi:hypothetical protein